MKKGLNTNQLLERILISSTLTFFSNQAVKKGWIILTSILFLFQIENIDAQTIIWTGGGGNNNWNNAANWDLNVVPSNTHQVRIDGAFTVSVPNVINTTLMNLLVRDGASLVIDNGAVINIDGAPAWGIQTNTNNAIITNNGTVNINSNIGARGIIIASNTSFVNNGLINIDDTGNGNPASGDGLDIRSNSSYTNTGHINIGPNLTADGIQLADNTTLTNSGFITILGAGATDSGVEDAGTGTNIIFNNTGTLCIESANIGGNDIDPGVSFNNTGTFNTSGCIATMPTVPTLGEWGLIILALLVLSSGTLFAMQPSLQTANGQNLNLPFSQINNWQIPFDKSTFLKIWIGTIALLTLIFSISAFLFGYEMTNADLPMSILVSGIFAFLGQLLIIGERSKK